MQKSYYTDGRLEAGCDEAGRGCLAGPVFAAAVVFPPDFDNKEINDSKQLTHKQLSELRTLIETHALAWAVAKIDPEEIDKINIRNASFKAMNLAVKQLKIQPECLLIDGNGFKNQTKIPYVCVVKGDATYLSIAAASVLAKTSRDLYMRELALQFPHYGWEKNKAYPTKEHRKAIQQYGICVHHRKTFALLPSQLSLKL
jgi:ribonuclease HII